MLLLFRIIHHKYYMISRFHGMAIIHTGKRHIRDELIKKMQVEALEKKKLENMKAVLTTREEAQVYYFNTLSFILTILIYMYTI